MNEKINFRKAKLGDKYIHIPTGKVCELISHYEEKVFSLRPVDYDGFMTYSVVSGCLNEQNQWEKVEDTWNIKNCDLLNYRYLDKQTVLCRKDVDVRTLKKKIIEDIYNDSKSRLSKDENLYIFRQDMCKILEARFEND